MQMYARGHILGALAAFVLAPAIALGAGPPSTDAWLLDQVRLRLAADPAVKASAINVSVNGGVVTLTGRTLTMRVKVAAQRVARHVKGVRSVINQLAVGPA